MTPAQALAALESVTGRRLDCAHARNPGTAVDHRPAVAEILAAAITYAEAVAREQAAAAIQEGIPA